MFHHMAAPSDLDGAGEPVEFMKDYVGLDYHNDGHTHIDAVCHVAYRGMFIAAPLRLLWRTGSPINLLAVL